MRLNAEVHPAFAKRGDDVVASAWTATEGARRSAARMCCWRSAAVPIRMIWAWKRPASQADERGYIVVDDQLRTNVPGIWALGDCNGKGALHAHFLQRFRNCRRESAGQRPAPGERPHPRPMRFTSIRRLGRAGMTETEVRKPRASAR